MSLSKLFATAILAGSAMYAQSVISAHSGTVHFTEGQVTLDGKDVQTKFGEFQDVKPGQVLATQDGRAEILLTPGVFLRLGENSSFKMVSNALSNTRLEVESGSAMIEVGELLQDNSIAVAFHGADISLAKRGLYRFDSSPNVFRVYDGEASLVTPSSDPVMVRKDHEVALGADKLEAKNFDAKATDDFYRWSARRDEYIAEANISAAKTARDAGYSGTGFGGAGITPVAYNGYGYSGFGGYGAGSWAWNPWFGMFTYVPYDGLFMSPFGYGYYSPYMVGGLYGPYSPFLYAGGTNGLFGSRPSTGTIVPSTNTALSRAQGFANAHGSTRANGMSSGYRGVNSGSFNAGNSGGFAAARGSNTGSDGGFAAARGSSGGFGGGASAGASRGGGFGGGSSAGASRGGASGGSHR